MTTRIFLSHSHKDNTWCDEFVRELSKYDTDVWYDREGLYAGAQWVRAIEDELSRRDIFLVAVTPEAWSSEWVREEVALAFASKKRIIAVILKQMALTGFITQRQHVDVRGLSPTQASKAVASNLGLTYRAQRPNQVQVPDISGLWTQVDYPYASLRVVQEGSTISGEWSASGMLGTGQALPIRGAISGNQVEFSYTPDDKSTITYTLQHVGGELVGVRRNVRKDGSIRRPEQQRFKR